jgi:hypothetical protein
MFLSFSYLLFLAHSTHCQLSSSNTSLHFLLRTPSCSCLYKQISQYMLWHSSKLLQHFKFRFSTTRHSLQAPTSGSGVSLYFHPCIHTASSSVQLSDNFVFKISCTVSIGSSTISIAGLNIRLCEG